LIDWMAVVAVEIDFVDVVGDQGDDTRLFIYPEGSS
jgi:hypothetical protein